MELAVGFGFCPMGFEFRPTNEQIMSYYLWKKLNGLGFRYDVINDIDINECEPWSLPGLSKIKSTDGPWYFFTELVYIDAEKKRINRKTREGFWKISGFHRLVKDRNGREIGVKKTLVFHKRGSPYNYGRAEWVMEEFHHKDAASFQRPYVLCRLKQNRHDVPAIYPFLRQLEEEVNLPSIEADDEQVATYAQELEGILFI